MHAPNAKMLGPKCNPFNLTPITYTDTILQPSRFYEGPAFYANAKISYFCLDSTCGQHFVSRSIDPDMRTPGASRRACGPGEYLVQFYNQANPGSNKYLF